VQAAKLARTVSVGDGAVSSPPYSTGASKSIERSFWVVAVKRKLPFQSRTIFFLSAGIVFTLRETAIKVFAVAQSFSSFEAPALFQFVNENKDEHLMASLAGQMIV